jgi:osmotically-inducible protein OsmY
MGGAGSGLYGGTGAWGGTDYATGEMLERGGSYPPGYGIGNFAGKGPRSYRRRDERIEEDVNEALTRHPDIDASEVTVRVSGGEVTLDGTVARRHERFLAEDLAADVSGVREVHNRIRVAP